MRDKKGTRLSDVLHQIEPEEVGPHLKDLATKITSFISEIAQHVHRSNESAALSNLGSETALQLGRLADAYPDQIETVAWCTRNLFELNLIVRYVLLSEKNLGRWLGQAAGDEKQMIEGFLSLSSNPDRPEVRVLNGRLAEIGEICRRHGIDAEKPFRMDKVAGEVGQLSEYVGLYKLFSKYVHPSSWLVNSPHTSRHSFEYLNVFLIHAQLYGADTWGRLQDWLKRQKNIPRPR